ncbi:glutaredoxin domain-containing protein [Streptomyces sp. NPDC055060]
MMRAWVLPFLLVLCGAFVAVGLVSGGSPGAAAAAAAGFVLLAVVHSPLFFPRSVSATEAARRSAADGRPVVFWRSGCPYCLRLRMRLGRDARRVHWVDIWRDPAGAEAVRAANEGDETVPTVLVSGRPHVNPDLAWVRAQVRRPPAGRMGRNGDRPRS